MGPAPLPPGWKSGYIHVDGSQISHLIIGRGMTGLILLVDDTRVLKILKLYNLACYEDESLEHTRMINQDNCEILKNERAIYERLGQHSGIIQCFNATDEVLELAYAKEGNLLEYIETQNEPPIATKVGWILSLIDTLLHIHARRVLVDEIALRNILVFNSDLKLADFGQSILLPLETERSKMDDGAGLTVKVELLHFGWIFYTISSWKNKRYYYFGHDTPAWRRLEELPSTDDLFFGPIIRKCWTGQFDTTETLRSEATAFFADHSPSPATSIAMA
jgi:hypothetical protein